jgi:hypothetical protein
MSKRIYKTWEDIYPLTLIQIRYGGKYVAFNAEQDAGFVQNVNPCPYGVGETIMDAMNNLLESMNRKI